ncbi:MAG: GIY-YIG nuclease family protein [Mogibacterium sp.]|nr:GIY-YIG nuclease family protein [Mogibacterium sp.]
MSNSIEKKHYVYILRCSDGTFYTGWTTDVQKRLEAHNSGKGAKYTRSRLPAELVYTEEYDDKIEAQKREYAIKQLSRSEKEALIDNNYDEDIHKPCLRFQR